jgi:PadR family transcriptional regulator PadR
LELATWIKGEWEDVDPAVVGRPRRRFYTLTASGQAEATKELNQYQMPGVPKWI